MFIELTNKETKEKIVINTNSIVCFIENKEAGHTKVFDVTSGNSFFTVKESSEEIISLISTQIKIREDNKAAVLHSFANRIQYMLNNFQP
jgi:hypothetical protein